MTKNEDLLDFFLKLITFSLPPLITRMTPNCAWSLLSGFKKETASGELIHMLSMLINRCTLMIICTRSNRQKIRSSPKCYQDDNSKIPFISQNLLQKMYSSLLSYFKNVWLMHTH